MKKTILFLSIELLLSTSVLADKKCFLVTENNKIMQQEGDCKSRHSPCSTFKIAISLIGFDSAILVDEENPTWEFKEGYVDYRDNWKQPHNPRLWMQHSCVWYSQVLTQKLGMDQFRNYIAKFNYGNQDISGDKGKDNGLTNSWLSSSLEISPEEQVQFLQQLVDNKLPVSLKSHSMTKNILFIENLPDGWKLYGKTGSGSRLNQDRTQKLDYKIGWFVGWIQKDERTIIFAHYIEDKDKQDSYADPRAKAAAKEKLLELIKNFSEKVEK
ncbi:class D beta-lactamase [Candidatus Trichorickettsia mobilis]|uniref:class D beta-lactamase n=1 Tax=Candidatus Trichorickettsia mobilis TaxID=1346319 RepID=UPI00292FE27C|nr:class D beta-lactamase [Candidatus Trichorickettsia mobilis]